MDDLQTFAVVAPTGTSPAQPTVVNLPMPARKVIGIEIVIPDGPRGVSGIALGAAGTPILPSNAGAYIVTNNEVVHWQYAKGIESGAWQAFVYNTGIFQHTYQVRFLMNLLGGANSTTPAFLDPATLSSSGG